MTSTYSASLVSPNLLAELLSAIFKNSITVHSNASVRILTRMLTDRNSTRFLRTIFYSISSSDIFPSYVAVL